MPPAKTLRTLSNLSKTKYRKQKAFFSSRKFASLKTLRIGVLCGGRSSERRISRKSGRAVFLALKRSGLRPFLVDPARSEWKKQIKKADVVFVALHGSGGEDGSMQQYLERQKIPFVGSGSKASAQSFNKATAKRIFQKNGIPTPRFTVVNRSNWKKKASECRFPAFVKPLVDGSSIGVFCVEDFAESAVTIKKAIVSYRDVMIEDRIHGREITVGILGTRALPVIELKVKREFYDYRSKYTKGMTRYLVPAPIAVSQSKKFQKLAMKVHRILGLRDLSRVDMMLNQQGEPFVLEVNTIPGMTEFSLLPKAARAVGISFEMLCCELVENAWNRG